MFVAERLHGQVGGEVSVDGEFGGFDVGQEQDKTKKGGNRHSQVSIPLFLMDRPFIFEISLFFFPFEK